MRRRHLSTSSFILLLAVAVAACTTTSLLVTGETLDALGQQFLETGKVFDALYEQRTITAKDYVAWAEFAKSFKAYYPQAVGLWKAAKASKDKEGLDQAESIIRHLRTQLLVFVTQAATTMKGGK